MPLERSRGRLAYWISSVDSDAWRVIAERPEIVDWVSPITSTSPKLSRGCSETKWVAGTSVALVLPSGCEESRGNAVGVMNACWGCGFSDNECGCVVSEKINWNLRNDHQNWRDREVLLFPYLSICCCQDPAVIGRCDRKYFVQLIIRNVWTNSFWRRLAALTFTEYGANGEEVATYHYQSHGRKNEHVATTI